jgi:flagellar protein FlbD
MIAVTRLDGTRMVVNADQIAWVETLPDTVVSMMNGDKVIVREDIDAVVARITEYKRSIVMPSFRSLYASGAPVETTRAGDGS